MDTDKLMIRSVLAGACAVGALAGCSSPPVPREQLAVGVSSVEAAQSAGAAELAPVELNKAREKLNMAVAAAREKQFVAARRLAEEADADAQVARTKANAERSRRAAEEVTAGIRTLQQQINKGDNSMMPNPPAAGNAGGSMAPNNNMDGQKMAPGTQPGMQPSSTKP